MLCRRMCLAALTAGVTVLAAGCGSGAAAPEPATAPPLTQRPAGRVVALPGGPEGVAVDARDAIVAVGIQQPAGVALVDAGTGRERQLVRLAGAPHHVELAGPAGPLLVPLENNRELVQLALPGGAVIGTTRVGQHPHDAAAVGSLIFVGNEFSNTVSLVRGGRQVAVLPGPLQPGGVAADGSYILVVGVRGRRVEAYAADGRVLGSARAGAGPTHVQAGRGGLFYVADTDGNAVLVFRVTAGGPRQVAAVRTGPGTPYGIAVDLRRGLVYVTLTATSRLESFRIVGASLVPDQTWPAVRQPNSVAVDDATGRVFVAGRTDGQLELIDPGTPGTPAPRQ